ncbi:MAG TPA: DMT family transporter [Steroidobacteraceae bacterium]|nr:DMT family transporter [Steroidobacteraceae bacterium]
MSFRAWGAFAALGIIWGLPYFLVKISVQELSPVLVAFGRIVLGAAILLPIAWRRGALGFPKALRPAILAFSLAEFVIPFCLISLGERWISSSVAGILIAMVPFWVALIQRFFGVHEPLGVLRSLGLGMGFAGVAALLGLGAISWPLGWLGVACILVAALGYAIGPLIIQRHMRELDSVGPLAASLAVASAVLAVPALLSLPPHLPSTAVLASMGALGIVCTAVAMLLMFYLVSHAGASRAAVITYINPAVATLLGVALLHERLGAGGVLAFVTILLGSWLATRGAPGHAAPVDA